MIIDEYLDKLAEDGKLKRGAKMVGTGAGLLGGALIADHLIRRPKSRAHAKAVGKVGAGLGILGAKHVAYPLALAAGAGLAAHAIHKRRKK